MPYIQNVEFQNETGQTLAGRLHLPRAPFAGRRYLHIVLPVPKTSPRPGGLPKACLCAGLAVLRFDLPALPSQKAILPAPAF